MENNSTVLVLVLYWDPQLSLSDVMWNPLVVCHKIGTKKKHGFLARIIQSLWGLYGT
jgi:hypothetical protein